MIGRSVLVHGVLVEIRMSSCVAHAVHVAGRTTPIHRVWCGSTIAREELHGPGADGSSLLVVERADARAPSTIVSGFFGWFSGLPFVPRDGARSDAAGTIYRLTLLDPRACRTATPCPQAMIQ